MSTLAETLTEQLKKKYLRLDLGPKAMTKSVTELAKELADFEKTIGVSILVEPSYPTSGEKVIFYRDKKRFVVDERGKAYTVEYQTPQPKNFLEKLLRLDPERVETPVTAETLAQAYLGAVESSIAAAKPTQQFLDKLRSSLILSNGK